MLSHLKSDCQRKLQILRKKWHRVVNQFFSYVAHFTPLGNQIPWYDDFLQKSFGCHDNQHYKFEPDMSGSHSPLPDLWWFSNNPQQVTNTASTLSLVKIYIKEYIFQNL